MDHFPLFSNARTFSVNEVWLYLTLFPDHKITSRKVSPHTLTTTHTYQDGLVFRLTWNIPKTPHVLSAFPHMNELANFVEKEWLTLNHSNLIQHSKAVVGMASKEARQRFEAHFPSQPTRMSDEEYRILEFPPSIQNRIDDAYLHALVSNYTKFQAYLKKTGRIH